MFQSSIFNWVFDSPPVPHGPFRPLINIVLSFFSVVIAIVIIFLFIFFILFIISFLGWIGTPLLSCTDACPLFFLNLLICVAKCPTTRQITYTNLTLIGCNRVANLSLTASITCKLQFASGGQLTLGLKGQATLLVRMSLLNLLQLRLDFALTLFTYCLNLLMYRLTKKCLVLCFLFFIFVRLWFAEDYF